MQTQAMDPSEGSANLDAAWSTERFYNHIDLEENRKAIEANPPPVKPARGQWRSPDVLAFLEAL